MPIERVVRMAYLGNGIRTLSADGQWVSYTVARRAASTPRGREIDLFLNSGLVWSATASDVWVAHRKSKENKNLTAGKGNNWAGCWSPDGQHLAFLSERDGSGQAKLWVWDVKQDRIRLVSDVPIRMPGPQPIEWTPDSRRVFVTAVPLGLSVRDFLAEAAPWALQEIIPAQPMGLTARVYQWPAVNGVKGQAVDPDALSSAPLVHDLIAIDVSSGQAATLVHDKKVVSFHGSADGKEVLYTAEERFAEAGTQQGLYGISVLTLADHADRLVASGIPLDLNADASLSPDGSQVAFRTNGWSEEKFDVFVANAAGGEIRNLTHFGKQPADVRRRTQTHWDFPPTILWDRDSKHIYFLHNGDLWSGSPQEGMSRKIAHIEGRRIRQILACATNLLCTDEEGSILLLTRDETQKQDGFYKIPASGRPAEKVLEQNECYTCESSVRGYHAMLSRDSRTVVYTSENSERSGDVWASDSAFRNPTQLTRVNPELSQYRMGKSELIRWLDDDGTQLEGVLTLPSNYVAGKRYPLVVLTYGGYNLSDALERFGGFDRSLPYMNIQLLATRGYAVLEPDAPQHMGTPMLDLAKTVLPAVNRVVELGIADPDRLGLLGQSYGGYSTLALLVQTNRFKAAVSTSGVGNLIGLFGEFEKDGTAYGTALGVGQTLVGSTPWEYRDRYIENSPVFYLDRIETPVLLVSGSDDVAVAPFLSDELFVGLRRLGKVVEYRKYDGEQHQVEGYANQVDLGNRITSWFEQYLQRSQ